MTDSRVLCPTASVNYSTSVSSTVTDTERECSTEGSSDRGSSDRWVQRNEVLRRYSVYLHSFTSGLLEYSLVVSPPGVVQFLVLDHEYRAQELPGDLVRSHPEQEGRH